MSKFLRNLPSDYNRALEKANVIRRINQACQKALDISEGKYEPTHENHLHAHRAVEILEYSCNEGPHLPMPLDVLAKQDSLPNAKMFVRTLGMCIHLEDKVLLCPLDRGTRGGRRGQAGGSGLWESVSLEMEAGEPPPHGELVHLFGSLCPKNRASGRGMNTVRARLWQKVTFEEAANIQEMLLWHPARAILGGRVSSRYIDTNVDRVNSGTAACSSSLRGAKRKEEENEVPYLPVPIEFLVSMEHLALDRTLVHTIGFCIYSYGKPYICSLESETASKLGYVRRDSEGAVGPWHSLPLQVSEGAVRSYRSRHSPFPPKFFFFHRTPLVVWGALCLDGSERLFLSVNMWFKPTLRTALQMQKEVEEKFTSLAAECVI